MPRPVPTSIRLSFRELSPGYLDAFHALVTDAHVRRFLFDGEVLSREWCVQAIARSRAMFDSTGVGLWLLLERDRPEAGPIGLCGFWVFPEVEPEPELLYALRGTRAGRGFATEAAVAVICFARAHAGFGDIHSAADEPNRASIHVLEKLGFLRTGEVPGAFGRIVLFRLPRDAPAGPRGKISEPV